MRHITMKGFLLLIFSLVTGGHERDGCKGRWVKFTCKNTVPLNFSTEEMRTFGNDSNKLNVIRILQQDDNGKVCSKNGSKKLRIGDCEDQIKHTVLIKDTTTINCGNRKINQTGREYLCKEMGKFTCDDFSSMIKNENYSETRHKSGFYVTINEITSKEEGVYWCVIKAHHAPAAYRKVTVLSDFIAFEKNAAIKKDFNHTCNYSEKQFNNTFLCKGEDPETCHRLVNSTPPSLSPERFTLNSDIYKKKIVLKINNVIEENKGVYWIGAESNNTKYEKHFLCRLVLTVDTHSPSTPQELIYDAFRMIVTLSVCVVLLVLLVVVLIFINKWKGRDRAAAQTVRKEEYVYEEIQMPAPDKTVRTVYATSGLSQDATSVHYTADNFPNRDKTVEPKPSSSRCENATVFSKSKDSCTIQSLPSEGPLYSNIHTQVKRGQPF